MTANAKGEVRLGDKVLRFGINELCDIETRFEKPAVEVLQGLQSGLSFQDLRGLFAIGLGLKDDREAGEVIEAAGGLAVASQKLAEAMEASFPAAKEGAADEAADPRAAASTG